MLATTALDFISCFKHYMITRYLGGDWLSCHVGLRVETALHVRWKVLTPHGWKRHSWVLMLTHLLLHTDSISALNHYGWTYSTVFILLIKLLPICASHINTVRTGSYREAAICLDLIYFPFLCQRGSTENVQQMGRFSGDIKMFTSWNKHGLL